VSITRRAFCAAAPSLLVLGGCGGGADTDGQATAGPASSCAYSTGQGVNVDLSRFYQQAAQQQQAMMWCWAACIAMVFASKGYPISQARIVSTAYGGTVNLPAYGITIAQALNRDWIDDLGRPFRSALTGIYDYQGGVANLTNSAIVSSIRSGTPVIIGTGSHARVLVAIDFQPTGAEPNIIGGTVFDPFTARLQCLSYQELFVAPAGGSIIFMATVNVA
jgi:hypothetical protein